MVMDEIGSSVAAPAERQSGRYHTPVQRPSFDRMSIAVFTRFPPSVGGIETVAELLAREWRAAGHAVTIITDVAISEDRGERFPFAVLHRPRPREVLRVLQNCDLVIH